MSPSPRDTLRVTAVALAHGGSAVCRTDAGVVFVPGLLPGESADVRIVTHRKGVTHAVLREILSASPHRLPHACPAAAAGAGCCDLSFTSSAHARHLKAEVLRDQLRRIGRMAGPLVDDVVCEAPLTSGPSGAGGADAGEPGPQDAMRSWRTVARWHTDSDGRPGALAAGTHDVVAEARCTQAVPELDEALDALVESGLAPPSAELAMRFGDGGIAAQWRPREGVDGASRTNPIRDPGGTATRNRRGADPRERRRRAQRRRAAQARSAGHTWRELPDAARVPSHAGVGDGTFGWRLPATAFWQPHRGAIATYQDHVDSALRVAGAEGAGERLRVWDLYSGVGALSVSPAKDAADRGIPVDLTLVETSPAAIASAEAAAPQVAERCPGLELAVRRAPVGSWLAEAAVAPPGGPQGRVDLVILDPPRTGLEDGVIPRLAELAPRRLVHIGCDLASFARDVAGLVAAGFEVESLTCVDAFPGTHHAEAVAHLRHAAGIGIRDGAT